MMEVKGVPPRSMIVMASRRKVFFDEQGAPLDNPNSKGKIRQPNSKSLQRMMGTDDLAFVDFVDQCLEWKPDKRLTPKDAMEHEWIRGSKSEL